MMLADNVVPLPSFIIRGNNFLSALNDANTHVAFGFQSTASFNLKRVHIYIASVTGTVTAANIQCAVMSARDPSGLPNAAGATATLSANPVAGVNTFVFATPVAMNANTMYWLRIRNLNGTPSSNYITLSRSVGYIDFVTADGPNTGAVAITTDGGTNWTYQNEYVHACALESDTGVVYGFITQVLSSVALPVNSFLGYRFIPTVNMQFMGVRVFWSGVSANTGATVRLEVWDESGMTLLWSSPNMPAYRQSLRLSGYSSGNYYQMVAGRRYIAGIRATAGTDASDQITRRTLHIGTNPLSLMGMEIAVHDGANWSFSTGATLGMSLLFKGLPYIQAGSIAPVVNRGVW